MRSQRSDGPVVVTMWWRDIPAQVNGQFGRKRHQVLLPDKFQRAIDRARRKAQIATAQHETDQWRRTTTRCGGDVVAHCEAEAERLEAAYTADYLGKLAYVGGVAANVEADHDRDDDERTEPMTNADAVVIGAGVIGSAVALELARSGRSVVVVDKGPGVGTGSTSASSAIIRFSYSTPDAIVTAWEAAAMWHDWAGHLATTDPDGMCRFIPTGNLILRTTGYDGVSMLEHWDEIGIPYDELDTAALSAKFPWLDTGKYYPPKRVDDPAFADDAAGDLSAIYSPDAGFIDDPTLAARNLAHAARGHGAEFRFHAEVTAIERTDDATGTTVAAGVTLADGSVIRAPIVVNVAGPHSSIVNRLAGVDDDMAIGHRALRQEVFIAPAPDGVALEDGVPLVADLDVGQYFRPQPGGTILVGGTEPECDPLHWVDDPDANSEHPTVDVFETVMLRLARRMPGFGVPSRPSGVAALYDASDDWVPIYDRSSLHGFFLACGTSGNQFKNAPIAGQFVRDIVDATMNGHDHDRDPVQFTGAQTGRTIDLGAFSRNRERAVTSGTVMG